MKVIDDEDLESSSRILTSASLSSSSSSDNLRPFEISSSEEVNIPKTAGWFTIGLLLTADVVGAGVLTLVTAFARLGWVLAFMSLIFWYIVGMYVGMLVSESKQAHPGVNSFPSLAAVTFGNKMRIITGVAVYSFLGFVLGDYLLIIGETLNMIFYDSTVCPPIWTAIGTFCLLPLSQIRLLGMTRGLMFFNVITIMSSIFIALGTLANTSEEDLRTFRGNTTGPVITEAVASSLTLLSFFHSQALFAFAYTGVFIYLEIISEMKDVKEFKYSLLYMSGPFQLFMYAFTGAWGYSLIGPGASGLLIRQIPLGPAYRISAFFLFVHLIITFVVKATVLSRAVHFYISPENANDFSSSKAFRQYFCISVSLLLFCFIVAIIIPFFDDLTGLLGSLQTPFTGFILPILFAIKSRKKLEKKTSKFEACFMGVIIGFMILLFFVGVTGSLKNIVDKWTTYHFTWRACF